MERCNAGTEQVQDTKMYSTVEQWCGMKCCKYEVDSLNRWEVIAIQT